MFEEIMPNSFLRNWFHPFIILLLLLSRTESVNAQRMKSSVKQTSGYISQPKIGNSGSHQLFYTLFEPEDAPVKATVLILHGMQEHSGRYADFARYLANNGLAVLVYDHLGHGKTAENDEDLGFFQDRQSKQQVIEDAQKMAIYLKDQQPDVPHFLLGHSMGSFIARCLLQQAGNAFDGAIIVGTGGKITGIGFAKAFLGIGNFIAPKKRSRFVNNSFAKMNNKRFKNEEGGDSTSWLSVSKANRAAFLTDSLNGVPFTNNGFYTLVSLNRQATKRNWAKNISKDLPFLFVSGGDDPIGDFGKGVRKTVAQMQTDGFNVVDSRLYPGMRHEILNEAIKEEVFAYINDWITKRI